MKKDCHFYALLAFCRACGFKKESAFTIAYASQFVDDATINYISIKEKPEDIECDSIDNIPCFFNMATAHSYDRPKTYNYSAMINNTVAFHFVPGCKGDSFVKKLRCKENSIIIREILDKAIKEDNLVKFGIILHAYADTFSHQGFSGIPSKVNDLVDVDVNEAWLDLKNPIKKIINHGFLWIKKQYDNFKLIETLLKTFNLGTFLPPYGHGQALDYPDYPEIIWSYRYDASTSFSENLISTKKINNKERFKNCFEKIITFLKDFLERHPQHKDNSIRYNDTKELFKTLTSDVSTKKRIKLWEKQIVSKNLFSEKDNITYDNKSWLKEAFENYDKKIFNQRKIENAILTKTFPSSHWYQFYISSKWYKTEFFKQCSKNGLKIPN